jgi:putative endonuclease
MSLRGEAVAIPFNSKQYYVYIMTNKINSVLYTGVTSDLKKRIFEHKEKVIDGFTKKYNINKLIFFEIYKDPENAILREKQIKEGPRAKKVKLIIGINPEWKDLYDTL